METVRIPAQKLRDRALLERMLERLTFVAIGFMVLFAALVGRLTYVSLIHPLLPNLPQARVYPPPPPTDGANPFSAPLVRAKRATITDRNGQILAISLPSASVYADPRQIIDADDVARKLKTVLPDIDADVLARRLSTNKQFVYVARDITPRQQIRVNDLGIPGIYFQPGERRRYPFGRTAAQVLGDVDVDDHGVAGVERYFDRRLLDDPDPLRLSLDVRVQAVVREELAKAVDAFTALGGCGIVLDAHTGEVLAMVSLPDFDANQFGDAPADARFNRCVTGMYEPGSTFKLQTFSMALDNDVVHVWDGFDASHPIHVGRFTITDYEGKHRFLYLPEILAYSSNIGAAKMAEACGTSMQQAWLRKMGMLNRLPIQLPEAGQPLYPSPANWKEIATLTIGFGHGIAVSPLHIAAGTVAVVDGGVYFPPTLLAVDPDSPPQGRRVMRQSVSDIMRRLMRLVVTNGTGEKARVPGYYVGGKTGTADIATRGGYRKHANVSSFVSAFPMNDPRYVVYIMLDDPHGTKATYGFSTAGWVAAPVAGRVIARIGPMLGLLPDTQNSAIINAALAQPLQPTRPPGAALRQTAGRSAIQIPPPPPPPRDLRHEARFLTGSETVARR
jgi:cell division protein FtsI (penicillin-binding protein 3)